MSAPLRKQFSIRHLLLLVLLVSVALALTTQFKHVGTAVAFFVIGAAAGWWFGGWRLSVASLTALLIFVAGYVACWVQLSHMAHMAGGRQLSTLAYVQMVRQAMSLYEEEHGRLPEKLDDLVAEPYGPGLRLTDAWRQPFEYRLLPLPEQFELVSLGRDGVAGGRGLDADLRLTALEEFDGYPAINERLPPIQFAYEAQGSFTVFMTILVTSILAGSLWFSTAQVPIQSRQWLVASLIATVVGSVIVATYLAAIYVLLGNSGH
jgi:general secretion pathway protein G